MSEQETTMPTDENVVTQEVVEDNESAEVENTEVEADSEDVSGPETQEELQDAVEEAIEDGASEEEIKDMIEEFELKVNGKRKKVKVDLNDKEDLKRRLQLAEAGRISMQELAELKRTVNEALLNAQQDPWSFLEKELNLDSDKLIEERLERMIEEKKKSPEQLEREKLLKELEDERKRAQMLQQEKEEQLYQSRLQQYQHELNMEITEALKSEPGLPKTQKTVRRIADALTQAMDKGIEDVTVQDVLPFVKRDIQNEMLQFMSAMPEEMMEAYIGKQNIERLRKKRLAAAKKAPKPVVENIKPTAVSDEEKGDREPEEKIPAKEYFRRLTGR